MATVTPLRRVDPKLPELDDPEPSWLKRHWKLVVLVLLAVILLAVLVSQRVALGFPVHAQGVIEPVRAWPVRSPVTGVVRDVFRSTGDSVFVNDPVAQIDSLPAQTNVGELQAKVQTQAVGAQKTASSTTLNRAKQSNAVADAQAQVIKARAALQQKMYGNGLGGNVDSLLADPTPGVYPDVDQAMADVRTAQSNLQLAMTQSQAAATDTSDQATERIQAAQLNAQLQAAQQQVLRFTVRSTATGVVVTPQTEQLVGSSVNTGDLLLEVTDPDLWSATFTVSEEDAKEIHTGDSVQVTVPGVEGITDKEPLRGSVLQVSRAPAPKGPVAGAPAGYVPPVRYRVVAVLDIGQLATLGTKTFNHQLQVQGKIVTREASLWEVAMAYARRALSKFKLKK